MSVIIREERPGELPAIMNLVEKAFENMEESDHREQFLVERLHYSNTYVPQLSLVAEDDGGRLVGYILLTTVEIRSEESSTVTLAVAPLAVAPDYQNQGIGGRLLTESHKIAASLGYGSAVLLGHPHYYPRFGYRQATSHGITFPFDAPQECCMVIELKPGALSNIRGTVRYPECFL